MAVSLCQRRVRLHGTGKIQGTGCCLFYIAVDAVDAVDAIMDAVDVHAEPKCFGKDEAMILRSNISVSNSKINPRCTPRASLCRRQREKSWPLRRSRRQTLRGCATPSHIFLQADVGAGTAVALAGYFRSVWCMNPSLA
jgi:hypothetical protein